MIFLYYIFLFIFGLIMGSFLNVVSLRYKPGKFVFSFNVLRGRSKCPNCNKKLSWVELIPIISFLIQRGKCKKCNQKISWQYPIVEFLTGLIFLFVPMFFVDFYNFFNNPVNNWLFFGLILAWILVFIVWLLISIIDIRHYLIPNELNLILGILGIVIIIFKLIISDFILPFHDSFLRHYTLIFSPTQNILINHTLGALLGGLFFLTLVLLSRGKGMGMGDVKLAFVSGLVLGWPEIALGLIIAFILGGIFGGILLLIGSKTLKDKLPFGPFMVTSMILAMLFGYQIVQAYLGFFGI